MISFDEVCYEAVKRFVQTAVVIDDQAGYFDGKIKKPTPPKVALTPPTGITTQIDPEPQAIDESCILDESDWDHSFDINPVVNGFAELKITCSIQRPIFGPEVEENEKLKKWALNCIEKSDIAIIDWRLFKDELHLSEDIIVELLRKDKKSGGKVRLLCVYTAQANPENILKDIKRRISEDLDLTVSGNLKDLAYTVGDNVRIAIFNKAESKVAGRASKTVAFDELPVVALKEFAILVRGLIPVATLHSIAAVREQTYSLLALMNKSLDGTFCAHRSLIPNPEDSVDFILDLIAKEISANILCDELARNVLSPTSIDSWLNGYQLPVNKYSVCKDRLRNFIKDGGTNQIEIQKEQAKTWLKINKEKRNKIQNSSNEKISYEDAEIIIEEGRFRELKGCLPPSSKKIGKYNELFYLKPGEALCSCNELSALSCTLRDRTIIRDIKDENLFLTAGSVLQVDSKNDGSEYWLCLQPRCDSVRLNEKTEILFLQLYNGNETGTDLIIRLQDGTYKALSIKPPGKKPRLKTNAFTPDKETGRILVRKLHKKYKWVAELRPEKVHLITEKVLNNASRSGIDEFELLRRKESRL